MSSVPCEKNDELRRRIDAFAEALKAEGHKLGDHGLSEAEFRQSGIFRGAIERLRGQFAASMADKREFAAMVLDALAEAGAIHSWTSTGETNRHDYEVILPDSRLSCIELKGCMDGNNTNIFERPAKADEFVIWSVCTNPGGDPRHNVWSGVHTRLSAEMISRSQHVDGLVVWDWLCGTIGRPCPKVNSGRAQLQRVGSYDLPPPCIYMFPSAIPDPTFAPRPEPHNIGDVGLLKALHGVFGQGTDDYLNSVEIEVRYRGDQLLRLTRINRGGTVAYEASRPTPIRRDSTRRGSNSEDLAAEN